MQAADTLQVLEELNRNYVRAAQEADLHWYRENLADDYVSGNPDGSFSDKAGFLSRIGRGAGGAQYAAENVRVHLLGDVALIHAGFRCQRPDGKIQMGSYTDAWALRGGRWLCVGAQFGLQPVLT